MTYDESGNFKNKPPTYAQVVKNKVDEDSKEEKKNNILEYDDYDAQILGMLITDMDQHFNTEEKYLEKRAKQYPQHAQQYLINKGLKMFKEIGEEAVYKEIKQQHDRKCFEPVHKEQLTKEELSKAQIALTYLTEKRDGRIKSRTVFNGKPTRTWIGKEDTASPTASTEGLFITGVIDAHEE